MQYLPPADPGSKRDLHPPMAQIFLIFIQFSGKFDKIIGWRPPSGLAPLWDILDPPLFAHLVHVKSNSVFCDGHSAWILLS